MNSFNQNKKHCAVPCQCGPSCQCDPDCHCKSKTCCGMPVSSSFCPNVVSSVSCCVWPETCCTVPAVPFVKDFHARTSYWTVTHPKDYYL